MSMKAHIEWGWSTGAMHVFLFERGPDRYFTVGEDGYLVAHEYRPEATNEARPALILEREILEVLLRASAEKVPPSDATVDALKDTRAVRDRLLAMVERAYQPSVIPPGQVEALRKGTSAS
jgi:hypothetical protein